jgi:hypothetical protein
MNCPMCGEPWNDERCDMCGWKEAPKKEHECPRCGLTMVERFDYQPINSLTSAAIPTGEFECLGCKRRPTKGDE